MAVCYSRHDGYCLKTKMHYVLDWVNRPNNYHLLGLFDPKLTLLVNMSLSLSALLSAR